MVVSQKGGGEAIVPCEERYLATNRVFRDDIHGCEYVDVALTASAKGHKFRSSAHPLQPEFLEDFRDIAPWKELIRGANGKVRLDRAVQVLLNPSSDSRIALRLTVIDTMTS